MAIKRYTLGAGPLKEWLSWQESDGGSPTFTPALFTIKGAGVTPKIGNVGDVLALSAGGKLRLLAPSGLSGANAATVTVVDASADTTCWVPLLRDQTGSLAVYSDAGLTYNANTNALTAATFVGALTGNVTGDVSGSSGSCTGNAATATTAGACSGNSATVTVADAGADTTCWVLLGTDQTGNLAPVTDVGFYYNAATDTVYASIFSGALSGNVTGNVSGSSGSCTGNAATVTNGLYSNGSYSNPSWLTSILGSIVSGNIAGNAASITGNITESQITDGTLLARLADATTVFGPASGVGTLAISAVASSLKLFALQTAGVNRWSLGTTNLEDETPNNGSDFLLQRYADNGEALGAALTVVRSTGAANFPYNFSVATSKFTVAAASGNTVVAGTLRSTDNFDVNTSKFTVNASTGDTVVAGTFTASGQGLFGGSAVASPILDLSGSTSTGKQVRFLSGGNRRWGIQVNSGESTANAGASLLIQRFADGGGYLADAMIITRSTGDGTFAASWTVGGDVAVNGGDLTSTAMAFNLLNTTVATLTIGGAATTVSMGAGATALFNANFATVVSNQTTVALLNTVSTTVNAFGAAAALTIGADNSGTCTIRNATVSIRVLDVTGNLNITANLNINTNKFQVVGSSGATTCASTLTAQRFIRTAQTFTENDATPSVAAGDVFYLTAGWMLTAISMFDEGTAGQEITVINTGGAFVPIVDGGSLKLNGDFNMGQDDVIKLVFNGTNWYELSRSAN